MKKGVALYEVSNRFGRHFFTNNEMRLFVFSQTPPYITSTATLIQNNNIILRAVHVFL